MEDETPSAQMSVKLKDYSTPTHTPYWMYNKLTTTGGVIL